MQDFTHDKKMTQIGIRKTRSFFQNPITPTFDVDAILKIREMRTLTDFQKSILISNIENCRGGKHEHNA